MGWPLSDNSNHHPPSRAWGGLILRKFFGVVLLAISVKFITKNLIEVIAMVQHGVAALGQ